MEYTIRAQFTPKNSKDYVFDDKMQDRYAGVSLFRGSRKVYIYQPYQFPKPVHLNFQIKQAVGGVFGFGSTTVTTQCVLVQNEYYPGDQVIIKIICDNRGCKSAVRNYKFKLYRITRHKHRVTGVVDKNESKLRQVKEKGCNAGEMLEKDFLFNIPMQLEDISKETQQMVNRTSSIDQTQLKFGKKTTSRIVHTDYDDDEKPRVNLTGSWLGQVFSVEYVLRVFVKYDNWMKHGEGEYISMPIKIINTPCLGPTQEPFRVPAEWNPI